MTHPPNSFRLGRRGLLAAVLAPGAALAQVPGGAPGGAMGGAMGGRREALRVVTAGVVNTLDPTMLGGTAEAGALSTCVYDRLLRFGSKPAGNAFVFDFERLEGELAESFELSPGGLTITLTLRQGALWHDGTPVTAADVTWSLARAVAAPSLSRAQLATGSLERAEQFTVLDDGRVRITLDRPDRLALPNLATTYAPMLNSRWARQHATADDPWARAWLKDNTAGGGAYTVQSSAPGQQTVLVRNEAWRNGPPGTSVPAFARLVVQTVPEAASRAVLVERGDADVATGLQPQDLRALESKPGVAVSSVPAPTGFGALIFNTGLPPFDQVAVRRALALAVPYEAIFAAALEGRGARLFGADWRGEPPGAGFPQPMPLHTDLVAARAMLAEAGHADGFATTLTYGLSRAGFADTTAALIQESFSQIGVRLTIQALPDAQMAAAVTAKGLPMLLERSMALFPSAEYFFRVFLSGDTRWNFASWRNPAVEALLPEARFEPDPVRAAALARRLIGLLADQVPMAMLFQPSLDVARSGSLNGPTLGPAGYPDLRLLARG